jgi:hypothetical protein
MADCPRCGIPCQFEGFCSFCLQNGNYFIKDKRRFFTWDALSNVLDYAAFFGATFIFMRHMHYSNLEMALQGLCTGWIMGYIARDR